MRQLPTPPTVAQVRELADAILAPDLRAVVQASPEAFASVVTVRIYEHEELVSSPEHPAEGMYVVVQGSVALAHGGPERAVLRGSVFGAFRRVDAGWPIRDHPRLAVLRGVQVWARALTDVEIWYLAAKRMPWARHTVPELGPALDFLHKMHRRHGALTEALASSILLKNMSRDALHTLMDRAERVDAEPNAVVIPSGSPTPGIHLVLAHTVIVDAPPPGPRSDPTTDPDAAQPVRLGIGGVFGDRETFLGLATTGNVVAGNHGAILARLPFETLAATFQCTPALRRMSEVSGLHRQILMTFVEASDPEFLLMQSDRSDVPLSMLTQLLAAEQRATYDDPVLVVEIVAPGGKPTLRREDDVPRLRLPVDLLPADVPGAGVVAAIAAALLMNGADLLDYAQVYLDPFARGATALVAPAVTRAIHLATDPMAPLAEPALRDRPVLRCALLQRGARLVGRLPVGTVRLRLDHADLARRRPRLPELDPDTRATIQRLGRAVTDRRVGIALGGGGAWGYAHAALLEGLVGGESPVPLDVVSGASFGSLLGAYFCARGLEGLRLLVAHGGRANAALALGTISSRALAVLVDDDLDGVRLEDLELPLFPVATDLVFQRPFIPRSGTLGWGVRMSSAFPPSLTAVLYRDMRLVDGGFVNNVPASVVAQEGANLIIASNIVSSAPKRPNPTPTTRAARFLSAFSPRARGLDAMRSAFGVFHETGVTESRLAHVVFQPSFSTPDFWDMRAGDRVIEASRELAEKTAGQVKLLWRELCEPARRPRHGARTPIYAVSS
jgi:predicted acylesterase/phospholipase RssA/CRP-like cAMP-binding protein